MLPKFFVIVSLSENKYVIERQAYTFMALLGDVGGFKDGILMVFTLLMTTYSAVHLHSALAKEIPVTSFI